MYPLSDIDSQRERETPREDVEPENWRWTKGFLCEGNRSRNLGSKRAMYGILLHNASLLPQHSLDSILPTLTPPFLCTSVAAQVLFVKWSQRSTLACSFCAEF